ncbi:hypothetical protein B0H66DRAFT_465701 [Apodospora peruviana]|uniref:Uncharacterized protein n=1 Tax=Apodospora peruviana TaxID=516989 RepID=A0AAE0IV95_9PEZI|nr:hypothetical protein B0H66DRAFT_465701 [Apodospora peruviana]
MAFLPALNPRLARSLLPSVVALVLIFLAFFSYTRYAPNGTPTFLKSIPGINSNSKTEPTPTIDRRPPTTHAPPKYKPTPTWAPPPVVDPFPLLANSAARPPPIPHYNMPRPNMHEEYGLERPPPLFIGFTRAWPMLLQAVVCYITAGWPADNIYIVENTGVHNKNKEGKLSLQNPFYLNHTTLQRLGVHVVQTPTLLTFAQMQNFFLSIAYQHDHPYYFYSHQDVVVFSFEDGPDNYDRPATRDYDFYDDEDKQAALYPAAANQLGYRSIYENCLRDLQMAIEKGERWGFRFYQYDHLALVNREAMDAVGGWDSLIPYYTTDCDMNGKLGMDGWTMKERRVGLINDVSTTFADLEVLYRNPALPRPKFVDPNPPSPEMQAKIDKEMAEKEAKAAKEEAARTDIEEKMPADPVAYFRILNKIGVDMGHYKYRARDVRNTWQTSQRGGQGEPFYYDPVGFARSWALLNEAGRTVYSEKWGHRDCNLVEGTALRMDDQWKVEKDWEEKKD